MRVVIADGDAFARRAMRDALQEGGIVVIAEAGNGREAMELALHYEPDVVIMDVALREVDGMAVTNRLVARNPGVAILLLSNDEDDEVGVGCLRAGATGFLPKTIPPTTLPRVVRAVAAGQPVVTCRLTKRLIESVRGFTPDAHGLRPVRSPLTARQWEVLDLLCDGLTTNEIAETLVVSPDTVRSHTKNIVRTLGVRSRGHAVEVARDLRSEMVKDPVTAASARPHPHANGSPDGGRPLGTVPA